MLLTKSITLIFFLIFSINSYAIDKSKDYSFATCEKAKNQSYNCHNDSQSQLDFFNELRRHLKLVFIKRKKNEDFLIRCYNKIIDDSKVQNLSPKCQNKIENEITTGLESQYKGMRIALALKQPEIRRDIIPQGYRPKYKFTINIRHPFPGLGNLEPLNNEEIENLIAFERNMLDGWKRNYPIKSSSVKWIYQKQKELIQDVLNKKYSLWKQEKKINRIKKIYQAEYDFSLNNYIQGQYKV
jgi:hypothetical protein